MPGNTSSDDEDWDRPKISPVNDLGAGSDTGRVHEPVPDLDWLVPEPSSGSIPSPPAMHLRGLTRRLPARGWAALAAAIAILVGAAVAVHGGHQPPRGGGTGPVMTSVSAAAGACAGLSGTVVTDRGGDRATVVGVIATFEDAYYRLRSAEAAMQVLAPETGITAQSLAAGIDTIPVGTTYCVAITPVTSNTANVHIVELHPDHKRVDYLQVINTIPAPGLGGGLLISHVQEQG
ncbi:hypothetical protein J2W56_006643 [Nocardia kruczakiae]|uniref:DUF8176 domain-containing protein n=1 Tax=Nocardia kruczakiae TaxID=261477 RepID=A0ABU1XSK5_9NOCA|nr:hypothetical protein [Nocardia kruczakiae]MDR7172877.1 hypothetical protein [Nocardia kruczakiae]